MNNWELTIQKLQTKEGKIYKVTRRYPEYSVAETKIFTKKEEALKQIEEWSK
jgi:predicted DNA-binding antitoxin AbrB/MazE fold protein